MFFLVKKQSTRCATVQRVLGRQTGGAGRSCMTSAAMVHADIIMPHTTM